MHLSWTLSKYLGRHFLMGLAIVLTAIISLIFLFDLVEHLRRGAGKDEVTFFVLLSMTALRLPLLIQTVLPFCFMFAAMFCYVRLSRSQELTVSRSAGVSVWQLLAPGLFVTFIVGVITITLFNPISSTLITQYEQLESKHLRGRESLLSVSESGLWLRQGDGENQSVIHALSANQHNMSLNDVIIFLYQGQDRFIGRIDAKSAVLAAGSWTLTDAWTSGPDQEARYYQTMPLETTLTREQILDSFAPPESLSFWDLPEFISVLEQAGFSGSRHLLYFHRLLALPVLLCAMVLIAAIFSVRLSNRSGIGYTVLSGVIVGFVLYFLSDVATAFGISGAIPPILAAWTPTLVTVLLGLSTLLLTEEG